MKRHIMLQNKIEEYVKKNEKINNDAQHNFDHQINKIENVNNDKLKETDVMIDEKI